MRRAHGYNYSPVPSDVTNGIEQENDHMTEELRDKIQTLKCLSIDIGTEVKYQDRLLNDIDGDFERSGGFMRHTMNRVLRLSKGRHNYFICYLLLFTVVVFFVLYVLIKMR